MRFQENGLDIIIFPPGGEKIDPGRTYKTIVTITNKEHSAGIKLEVSLDLKPELQKWCRKRSHKISIGYLQSQEIEFLWDIPLQAPSDTYDYNLRIAFLKSTSFSSFQPKRRQLTILPTKIAPPTNNSEPSFLITPASSSIKPITLSIRETLNLEIDVHNRSNRTDNFRISTDLEAAWYIIRYPETIERPGVIDGNEALNLNPGDKGKIYLTINPPDDTVAGNYKPEIQLHSLNSPEQFLKKIVYLNIPPQYLLQAELQIILNKVSHKKGQYKIILTNQGNTFRKIEIQAQSSDEDECCEYFLEKSSVRISPNKTVEIKLEVQPNSKQKRPLLSTKQFNFKVDLIDKNNHPLPKSLPLKSNLFLRSRPLWQTILLFLLALGCVGGAAWFIWKIITRKQPKPELTLTPEKPEVYYNGEPITVNWTVKNLGERNNPESINKIIIFDQERKQDSINTKCYVFNKELEKDNCYLIDKFINPENNTPDKSYGECISNNNTKTISFSCSEVIFNHAQEVKNYVFELQGFTAKEPFEPINDEPITTEPVSILPIPTLKIVEPLTIYPEEDTYKPKSTIKLNFEVSDIKNYFIKKDKIFLLINNQRQQTPIITKENINDFCLKSHGDNYSCNIKISSFTDDGKYNLGIELQHDADGHGKVDKPIERHKVPKQIIVQTPIKFEKFTINGRSNTQIEVEPNTPIIVRWSVRGKEVKTNISCIPENIGSSGTKSIQVLPGKSKSCILTASDVHNNSINPKEITVFVKDLPEE